MKLLLIIAKYITAVAVIGGAALWFDARFDDSVKNQEVVMDSIATLRQEVEYINVEQSFMSEGIDNINTKVDENTEKLTDITRAGKFYIEHQEEYTKDQLEDIMDEILKKNNGWILLNGIPDTISLLKIYNNFLNPLSEDYMTYNLYPLIP